MHRQPQRAVMWRGEMRRRGTEATAAAWAPKRRVQRWARPHWAAAAAVRPAAATTQTARPHSCRRQHQAREVIHQTRQTDAACCVPMLLVPSSAHKANSSRDERGAACRRAGGRRRRQGEEVRLEEPEVDTALPPVSLRSRLFSLPVCVVFPVGPLCPLPSLRTFSSQRSLDSKGSPNHHRNERANSTQTGTQATQRRESKRAGQQALAHMRCTHFDAIWSVR
jgi:hypothetical protein